MESYDDVIHYLFSLRRFGMKLRLEAMELLLRRIGEPHKKLRVIHVAGTKGKGSVCSMIASVLQQAGYKVGLFTSPHLMNYTERFRTNGMEISRGDVVRLARTVRKAAEQIAKTEGRELTFFEITTGICFLYFHEQNVDFAVLEVGLGGRLDATNVCLPLITIITNIDYEHTEYLGNTLASIAREKAGIIKKGILVICGVEEEEPLNVIREVAKQKQAELLLLGKELKFKTLSSDMNGTVASFVTPHSVYPRVRIHLLGEHQVSNTALAITAIDVLRAKGYKIKKRDVLKGLSAVRWPGRLEVVRKNPLIIVDCAHTVKSAETLVKSMNLFRYKRFVLVIGISQDKDINGILEKLIPIADLVVATKAATERACSPSLIGKIAETHGKKVIITNSVQEAIETSNSAAGKGDIVLITGSIFTVSEALQVLHNRGGDGLSELLKPLDILVENLSKQLGLPTILKNVERGEPFKVLIATILSQRTRDENTRKATEQLFSVYKDSKAIAEAELKEIEKLIRPSGFYRVKAAKVKEVARIIHEKYGGKVPNDIETLLSLPGVGRKTANCVLVYGFKKDAIPVDTHVHRISNRLGLVCTSRPEETELELERIVPRKHWIALNDLLVRFGQKICRPVGPKCSECSVNAMCPAYKTKH